MKIVFDTKAISDLQNIRRWIAFESPSAAAKVLERLFRSIRSLVVFPERGRKGLESGTRELVVPGLPYVIVYKIRTDTNEIDVAAVLHNAQGRTPPND
jgi:toxin ParE1/3/4